jgi:hypothetical protein
MELVELDQWWAHVNAVMNWFHKMWGNSWLAEGLLASQGLLYVLVWYYHCPIVVNIEIGKRCFNQGLASASVWMLRREYFFPYQNWSPNYPAGWREAILTMLHWPQKFYPRRGHDDLTLAALSIGKEPYSQCTGDWVVPRTCLIWCRKLVPATGFDPRASCSTDYAGLADKTLNIRYTETIRYTSSNNPKVAYAVHTLNNCH